MMAMGVADENTVFVCTHFSHNGVTCIYDDLVPIAENQGLTVSYDGMILNI